jgi:ribosomal protein S8
MLYLIKKIKLYSKPSNKKYIKYLQLKQLIKKNNEFGLISTSQKGVITFSEALKLKVGGEIVFYLKSITK